MLFKKRRKKSSKVQIGMDTAELLLLFETRSFLQEVLKTKIRLSKWQKTLEEGSVYFIFSELKISFEMTTSDRKKMWVFTLLPKTSEFQVEFKKLDYGTVKYIPLEEDGAIINEIQDILVLIYYFDFLHTKNINGYKKHEGDIKEHIRSMSEKYCFNYSDLNNAIKAQTLVCQTNR